MKDKILALHKYLEGIRSQRAGFQAKKNEQQAWLKKYEKYEQGGQGDFDQEIKNARAKLAEIEAQERSFNGQVLEKLMTDGAEIAQLMNEAVNQPIDHSDSKLKDALAAISIGGMDYKRASDIVSQFRGNQPVLHYLKDVFAEKKINSNIDQLIYDPATFEHNVNDQAFQVSLRGMAPESLQSYLGKVAAYQGIELPGVDMDAVFNAALRAGAGLPVPSEQSQ